MIIIPILPAAVAAWGFASGRRTVGWVALVVTAGLMLMAYNATKGRP